VAEPPRPRGVYRRLLRYAEPHWPMMALGVLGMAVFAAIDAALAWLLKVFLDGTFVARDPRVIVWMPLAIVALFALRGSGDFLASFAPASVGRRVIKALRADVFRHCLALPASYFDRQSPAALLTRLTYNVELVAEATTTALTTLVKDSLTIVGLLGYLLWCNWRLTLIALAIAPPVALLMRIANRLFRRHSKRIQDSMVDITRVVREAIENQRLIKVFTAEAHERALFESANEHNRRTHMKLVRVRASTNPVVLMIASLGLATVMFFAVRAVFHASMTVGEFTSFLAALVMLTAPLRRLVNVAGPLAQGIAAGQSVFEVLDESAEDAGGPVRLARARGELVFERVDFAYRADQPAVLADVSFATGAGRTVAIVGRSGSGKSTLVSLIPRFHDPTAGRILLDGRPLADYARADLRRQIALVSQDAPLLDDTLRNNIAFGVPDADPVAVDRAAEAAYVLEFASELPAGLDTRVGDRGTLLSGGQRQRVAIARALLKDAPVLILDEATAALDSESERSIQAALARLKQGRTTLVIAHRLSTIESADLILVLQDGAIVERGTHAGLLAAGGVYAGLHRLQFNG
jgi:subfamily B ATP-binding cassette protein MsbA